MSNKSFDSTWNGSRVLLLQFELELECNFHSSFKENLIFHSVSKPHFSFHLILILMSFY